MTTQTQLCSENKPALDKQSRLILLGSLFAAGLATPASAQENLSAPASAPYASESVAAARDQAQFPGNLVGAPAPSTLLTNQVTSMSASTSGTVGCEPNQAAGTVCLPRNLGCQESPVMCGNPINAAMGNKIQQEMDFVGGASTGLELRRTYNSLSLDVNTKYRVAQPWTFGAKWSSTWERRLHRTVFSGSKLTLTDMITIPQANGRVAVFFYTEWYLSKDNPPPKIWSYPDETSRLSLVKNASGQAIGWQLVTDDDTTELYGLPDNRSLGNLLSITTRAGLKTTLTYDTKNQLAKVTGPFGHTLSFTYNANRVSRMTTPDGRVYAYAYDAKNNLTSVTYPGGAVRKYLYENSKFPDALTGIVDENGVRFATYGYDEEGRATLSEHAGGVEKTTVDYSGYSSSYVTDARGNSYSNELITEFGVVKPSYLSGAVPSSVGNQSFLYDNKGFLSSRTDFNGHETTYTRDARGLELSRTEAVGTPQARTITTAWHPTFHLPTRVTEPGRVTTFTYDAKGNLLQRKVTAGTQTRVWTYTYNTRGQVLTVDGPRTDVRDVTTFSYDARGNLATRTNALGRVTRFTYDAAGRRLTVLDPNGLLTKFSYDARGRLIALVEGTKTTTLVYDAVGQLKKVTLPDGSLRTYNYDAAHRLTRVADAMGNRLVYTLDVMSNRIKEEVFAANTVTRTRSYEYDWRNRLWRETGALNQNTYYYYDDNDNLTSILGPLSRTTDYWYDALNRLVKTRAPDYSVVEFAYDSLDRLRSVTDPRKLKTAYGYDGLDNQTAIASPDAGQTVETHDAAGNVLTSTDARGRKTTYSYDALNRLTRAAFADGKTITYGYDQGPNGLGRLTSMADSSSVTRWSYDRQGRVIRKQQQVGTVTLTTTLTYNAAGQLTRVVYPSGQQVGYAYDPNGRVDQISLGVRILVNGIQYESFGPVNRWIWGNGQASYRDFDLDGLLASYSLPQGARQLDYDAANRITAITDAAAKQDFRYDRLDRLTYYASGTTTQSYSYDANGNRLGLSANTGRTNYKYAATSNRLLERSGAAISTYTYDAAGNLIKDGAFTYTYDARGRLATVIRGTLRNDYAINGLGQRVAKSGAGVPTGRQLFVYDGARLIGEYDAQGKPAQETIWLGDLPVSISKGGAQYSIYPDHLGTPRVITNQSNAVVWKWDSDPFGNGAPTGSAGFTYNLRFPGQYFDAETGLHYNNARDYNPALGRYVQSDPIGLGGGINTYTYVKGNPIMFVDPDGLVCVYKQSTGSLSCTDDKGDTYLTCNGYAGTGTGRNNPEAQGQSNVGPVPQGQYTVGDTHTHTTAGANTRRLTPAETNEMEGRSGFLIHGNNAANDASHGCIVLPPECRIQIRSGETLQVMR